MQTYFSIMEVNVKYYSNKLNYIAINIISYSYNPYGGSATKYCLIQL